MRESYRAEYVCEGCLKIHAKKVDAERCEEICFGRKNCKHEDNMYDIDEGGFEAKCINCGKVRNISRDGIENDIKVLFEKIWKRNHAEGWDANGSPV